MKNGNAQIRGFGRSLKVLVFVSSVLLLATSPVMAQQENFPGEIVGVGELPPILSGPYKIQVGDVLDIQFFKTIELNQTRTVGPDGEIYLPIVGRVDVISPHIKPDKLLLAGPFREKSERHHTARRAG